jgi:hypothetical protein
VQDRPNATELLDAVRGFIESDLMPALEGRRQFHARVAANVLAIVQREIELEPQHLAAEWQRLDALLGGEDLPTERTAALQALRARNETLCELIRAGGADEGQERRGAVLRHVRQTVEEKLAVANPKLLAAQKQRRGEA